MSLDFEAPIDAVEQRIDELKKQATDAGSEPDAAELAKLEAELAQQIQDIYAKLTPWQRVLVARHENRPQISDYISFIFKDFYELHGDRCFGDDKAIVGGFATIDKYKVMLLGFSKGRTVEDRVKFNFGMAHPEGYRKALRLMKLAAKYGLPVVSLVDTPAAYPGAAAEERGQAEAIGRNITEMIGLPTPVIVVITGEGGSGGALGVAVGDVVSMLSNAIYSVIPPEGCAAILWRDAAMAPQAAEALKITAPSLLELGVIDEIIEEPAGGAHRNPAAAAAVLQKSLTAHLNDLRRTSSRRLLIRRFRKYAEIGRYRG